MFVKTRFGEFKVHVNPSNPRDAERLAAQLRSKLGGHVETRREE